MESTPWDPEGVTVTLDSQGRLADPAVSPPVDPRPLLAALVEARELDVRLERLGPPHFTSARGEEAVPVALARVARSGDWVYPGPRDVALAWARGLPVQGVMRALFGGEGFGDRERKLGPGTDALGQALAIAVGHARGLALEARSQLVFASFGEGMTTTGAFYESLVTAVVAAVPVVFVCRSQLWPEGAPAEAGLVGDAVADRSKALGIWSRRVDGADPIGVELALTAGAERSRAGRGPSLIEVVVTRLGAKDVPAHRDPLERLASHLRRDDEGVDAWVLAERARVRTAFDVAFAPWDDDRAREVPR